MSVDYDVSQSFKRIENELIESMVRNFKRHRVDEAKEGFTWEQWQVLQLKELEKYRLANPKKFQGDFSEINQKVGDALKTTYTDAKSAEEAKILEQIKKGKIRQTRGSGAIAGKFFGVNAGRIEHLIEATKADFGRGEWAILRQANDQYRKIIFNAQMYSATGATYEQAVDMATKDFLKAGIQSITYKNGARHTMADYSRMALKTGQKRAYLMGEGDVHDKYGIHTVRVNKRTDACPLCVKWLGKVLVDDVYAGGTAEEAQKAGVPLLSEAIDEGFLHPNCKDVYSMYIEGVSKPADPWSKKELKEIADKYNAEQALQRAEDMQASYQRMADNSLDKMNVQRYQARADAWKLRADEIRAGAPPTPIIPATPAKAENEPLWVTTNAQTTEAGQKLLQRANAEGIKYREAQIMDTALSEAEMIQKISGGDKTSGSCVSLAMTWMANRFGLDVKDFRGGTSCDFFARNYNNRRLCDLSGVKSVVEQDFSSFKLTHKLFDTMQEGKEYMLCTGRHASIIRKVSPTATNPSGLEYMELQSATFSGWRAFEDTAHGRTIDKTLKNRFGCTKSRTSYGMKLKQNGFLLDCESVNGNAEFKEMLGYINTEAGKEKKGVSGSVK